MCVSDTEEVEPKADPAEDRDEHLSPGGPVVVGLAVVGLVSHERNRQQRAEDAVARDRREGVAFGDSGDCRQQCGHGRRDRRDDADPSVADRGEEAHVGDAGRETAHGAQAQVVDREIARAEQDGDRDERHECGEEHHEARFQRAARATVDTAEEVRDPDEERGEEGEDDGHVAPTIAGMILRPLAEGDEAELLRIHMTPEVIRWWDAPEQDFPWDEPESTRLTIEVDGAIVGLIQYTEETRAEVPPCGDRPVSRSRPARTRLRQRGGRRVVRLLIDERGHHRITIDPAVKNVAAIRAYEKAGFKPVGVMRQAERDADGSGWHDALLMELLAGEEL